MGIIGSIGLIGGCVMAGGVMAGCFDLFTLFIYFIYF